MTDLCGRHRLRRTDSHHVPFASADIVAADSYAATLFGMTGADVPAIVAGADMGLGIMNLDSIRIQEIEV